MKQSELSLSSPASVCKGWGAFFSPPIFPQTYMEREALNRENSGGRAFVKALDTVYKGRQAIVTREGLVVLAEAQKAAAVELLNEVMAVVLFRGIPVLGIRDMDLVECSIAMANKEIDGGQWLYKTGNGALLEKGFEGWNVKNARFYHPDNIRGFIQRAELMTSHPTVRMDLRLLLEAYTRHQESAFTISLLLSWLGIARLLEAKWRNLADQRPSDDGTESATPDPCWNADRVIEELLSRNALDPSAYQEAKRLCGKHSNLIRSDEEATIGESASCFHLFLSQLRKTLASE